MKPEEPEICDFCFKGTLRFIPGAPKPICPTCNMDYNAIGQGLAVKKIRMKMGKSQKEIAELYGVDIQTIRAYESQRYTRKYFDWLQVLTKDFYEND